jgi:hypothetical protein
MPSFDSRSKKSKRQSLNFNTGMSNQTTSKEFLMDSESKSRMRNTKNNVDIYGKIIF